MARSYTLPAGLLAQIADLPNTRTAVLRDALGTVTDLDIVEALKTRLRLGPGTPGAGVRVTLSVTDADLDALDYLNRCFQIGMENVMRLLLEAYVAKVTLKKQSRRIAGRKVS